MRARTATLAPLLLLAALVTTGAYAAPDVGQPGPAFNLPVRGGGAPISLAGLKGQVVMVNFWASWCAPCRQEFPLLDSIYKKYKSLGFSLVGINVEPDSKLADGFLAQTPVSFPILFDAKSDISKAYGVNAMPTTFLVDRKGTVRWMHRAYKPGDENEYLDQVRALLREK
jgi:thiol-disulfide isomerase/thioredoxin